MRIDVPRISRAGSQVEYSVPYELGRVGSGRGEHQGTLWYRIPAEYQEMVSPRADAALLALLVPAMVTGGDLHVAGPVTDELAFSLEHGYQDVLRSVIPRLEPVRVIAPRRVPATSRPAAVATGFSAGVDSFAVLADHFYDPEVPASLRVTHMLFNRVGSHDDAGPAEHALFLDRCDRASRVADKIGLPLIAVDSNLTEAFRGTHLNFQQTHTPRNASVAFLLQSGIGRWLYASALPMQSVALTKFFDVTVTDPVALPMLSTGSLVLGQHGGQYSRFEKTMRVADIPDSYSALDVCVSGQLGHNCSKCFKCLRTMVALEIGGVLERYDAVFDLDVYRRHRDDYLTFMSVARFGRDPTVRELIGHARSRGLPMPRVSLPRLWSVLYEHAKWRMRT